MVFSQIFLVVLHLIITLITMATTLTLADMYISMLSALPNDTKLDIISKLTSSMRKKHHAVKTAEVFACFNTDWGGDRTAEQIADELRASRNVSRDTEIW